MVKVNWSSSKNTRLLTFEKSLDSISVTSFKGPLKHLENKWFFKQKGNNSEVNFYVDFYVDFGIDLYVDFYVDIGVDFYVDFGVDFYVDLGSVMLILGLIFM